MIFDTHAHYDDEAFNEDREEVLLKMQEMGVGTIVDIGESMESSHRALELAK
ncbi:MAG: TatD family hydrolase, partial [Lachnospiraceae bacterium]|nr:TatD family hydrolase [Lachnospiraceae bacterium]